MNKNHTIFFNPLLHDIPYEYHDTNPSTTKSYFIFMYLFILGELYPTFESSLTYSHHGLFTSIFRNTWQYGFPHNPVQPTLQKTGQKVLEFRPGLSHSIITSSDSTFCRIAFLRTHLESTSISQNFLNIT